MKANNETEAVLDACVDTLLQYEARQTNQIDFTKSKCMEVVLCLIEQSHSNYFHLYEMLISGKVDYIHIMNYVNGLREMTPEQELLISVFGKRTDADKMRDIESALTESIVALHDKRIPRYKADEIIRTLSIARQTLRELNIPSLEDNSEYQFNVERFASIERD